MQQPVGKVRTLSHTPNCAPRARCVWSTVDANNQSAVTLITKCRERSLMRSVRARSICGRGILRMIYCHVNDNRVWRARNYYELYTFCVEIDTVKVIKKYGDWSGWDTSLECKNWSMLKGTCRVKVRWLESVAEDLKNTENWRRKSQDWEQWRTILEEVKVHQGL